MKDRDERQHEEGDEPAAVAAETVAAEPVAAEPVANQSAEGGPKAEPEQLRRNIEQTRSELGDAPVRGLVAGWVYRARLPRTRSPRRGGPRGGGVERLSCHRARA